MTEGPKVNDSESLTFEQAVQKLEEIVNRLMSSGVPLEEMISLYEQGVRISKQCMKQLDDYDARIEVLSWADQKTDASLCEELE
jgi:exodeoxyribonuclease VII small subunit